MENIDNKLSEMQDEIDFLKKNLDFYKTLIDSSVVWQILMKPSGELLYCSPFCKNISGYEANEFIENPDLFIQIIHPDDRELYLKHLNKKKQGIEAENTLKFRIITKDGKEKWLEHICSKHYISIDEFIGYLSINRDITERKKAKDSLRLAEFKFRTFADYTYEWEYWADAHNNFVYITPSCQFITGYTPDEFISNPKLLNQIIHPDDVDAFHKHHEKSFSNKSNDRVRELEFRIIKKDGSVAIIHHTCRPIYNEENELLGRRVTNRDITEQKQVEEELKIAKAKAEESDRLKTAFLQNMSHEIRTPLNGILGFSNLLRRNNLGAKEIKEYTNVISQSGQRLLEIVNNVLDIAKIETGQMEIRDNTFSLNSTIQNLYSFFSLLAESKNIQLNYKTALDNTKSQIVTDETKLNQILTNLINNAIKFTQNGSIDFGYEIANNEIQFYVKDTGIGIAPEFQDKIFERFVQVDLNITRGFEGAGLGLSICKGLVEKLGGKIWVESEVNKGSTFFFTIPYKPEISETKTEDEAKDETYSGKKIKILIAEDDLVSYLYLSKLLKDSRFQLIHAENGREAVEFVKNTPDIDLVLMDMRMPEMDGFEATQQIKAIRPELPIIAQTAYAFQDEREKILSIGCDDYLSKPIDDNKLKILIKKFL
jgi:hypothetical protein